MFSVNTTVNSKKTNSRNHFEALESRQLMSASLTHALTPEAARIHVKEELHVHATGAGVATVAEGALGSGIEFDDAAFVIDRPGTPEGSGQPGAVARRTAHLGGI